MSPRHSLVSVSSAGPSRTLVACASAAPSLLARKHGAKQKSADNTISHTALALLSLLLQALWHSGHALNGRSRRTHKRRQLTPTPSLGRNLLLPKELCRPHSQAIGGNGDDDSNGDDDGNGMPHGDCDDEQPPPSASAPNEPTSAARHQHDDGNNNDKDDETAHRHDTSAASAHASATTDAALLAFVQAAAAAARTPPGPTANELGSVGSARHIAPPRGGGQPSALAEVTKTAAGDDNRKRGSGGARRRHDVTVDAELYCSFPVQAARHGMQRSPARRDG